MLRLGHRFIRHLALSAAIGLAANHLRAGETNSTSMASIPGVKAMDVPGIHNMFSVGDKILSGSAPEGDDAFAALAKLGVKTIITVDGSKPDIETAHKHGIRYIHLPHGYDGINTNTQAMLVKAAETADGPLFVHCHHGKHRGPAAVAVICMSELGWTPIVAENWLKAAGTATNYPGLYDVARHFQKPGAEQLKALPSTFPEVAQTSGLTEAMVEVDERWDHLKAIRAAGYKAPKEHPDIDPANEAVILWEHFRESQRYPESKHHGTKFLAGLEASENQVKEAEQLLRDYATKPSNDLKGKLDKSFDAIAKSCTSCHKEFRDPAGIKSR